MKWTRSVRNLTAHVTSTGYRFLVYKKLKNLNVSIVSNTGTGTKHFTLGVPVYTSDKSG